MVKNAPPQDLIISKELDELEESQTFSYALTALRNNTHDNHYYENTNKLTFGLNPPAF